MAFLFRVFLLIALLSSAVSKPLPYTIERLEYGVNENDVRDIEQERASGVDERSIEIAHPREAMSLKSPAQRFTSEIVRYLNRLGFKDPATVSQATNLIEDKLDGVSMIKADQIRQRDLRMGAGDVARQEESQSAANAEPNSGMTFTKDMMVGDIDGGAESAKIMERKEGINMENEMMQDEDQRNLDPGVDMGMEGSTASGTGEVKEGMHNEKSSPHQQQRGEQERRVVDQQEEEHEEQDQSQSQAQDKPEESMAMEQAEN